MTRRRWIADEVSGNTAVLTGQNAQHLARVLRAKIGQQFDIAAHGSVRRGTVRALSDNRVEFELGDDVAMAALPEIHLLLAVFKFDRMEWALEKAAELGVSRLVPVIAERTERHLAAAAGKRTERWRRIAREAAQQARRDAAPEIREPLPLSEAITSAAHFPTRVLLDENETQTPLAKALAGKLPAVLAIGPEGGWTADERAAFGKAGWTAGSLGPTILRAETAAIAALAVAFSTLAGEEK